MASTVYDINVKYQLDDKASAGLGKIEGKAQGASRQTMNLARTLKTLATGAAGFMAFRLGKRFLIDYNSNIEQAKIQMGGLLNMNMGGEWSRNQKRANFLVQRFQKDAAASVGTTKDFVDMGSLLTGPLSRAGASMEDIADITKATTIAAKAFGMESEVAARDIEQAMAGTLGQKDRFARALLDPVGMTTKKWNAMVKKSPQEAAQTLLKVLTTGKTGKALSKMADEQKNSWAGLTSTIEDNLERALAKVGIPLMKVLNAEMQNLISWFENNPKKIEEMATNIGNGLVSAFKVVKSVFSFIARHKDLLMTIAKTVLLMKGIGGVGKGMVSLFSPMQTAANGAATSVMGFQKGVGGVLSGLGRAAGILEDTRTATIRDKSKRLEHLSRLQRQAAFNKIKFSAGAHAKERDFRAAFAIKDQVQQNYMTRGKIDRVKIKRDFGLKYADKEHSYLGLGTKKQIAADTSKLNEIVASMELAFELNNFENHRTMQDFIGGITRTFADDIRARAELNGGLLSGLSSLFSGPTSIWQMAGDWMENAVNKDDVRKDKKDKVGGARNTNVKINKIEVVSDDPDRFAHNLIGAFDDTTTSVTQAARTVSEQ
jgi:hypothetical protein